MPASIYGLMPDPILFSPSLGVFVDILVLGR
jgi:hypothetical protein